MSGWGRCCHIWRPVEEAPCPSSAGSENVAGFSWWPDAAAASGKKKKQKDKLGKYKETLQHVPAWMYTNSPSFYCFDFYTYTSGTFHAQGWRERRQQYLSADWHMSHETVHRHRPRAHIFLVQCYFLKLHRGFYSTRDDREAYINHLCRRCACVPVCVRACMYSIDIYEDIRVYCMYKSRHRKQRTLAYCHSRGRGTTPHPSISFLSLML